MSDGLIGGHISAMATEKLHESIKEFNVQSSKQTEEVIRLTQQMLWLTRIIALLTLVMAIGVGVQIYLAKYGA